MRRLLGLTALLLGACATTPAPAAPAAPAPESKTTPVTPQEAEDVPAIALDLTELTLRIEADGTSVLTIKERFKLLASEPGPRWSHVFAFWRPWLGEPPTIDATVVTPDGTVLRLDPKTISDQADRNESGQLTDNKLRIAPLPGLAIGAIVERTSVTTRKPLLLAGASMGLSFEAPAPEKKRVFIIDTPVGVPLHLETFDIDLAPTRSEANGRVVVRYERGPATPKAPAPVGSPPSLRADPLLRVSTVPSWQAAASAWAARVDSQLEVPVVKALATSLTAGQTTREGKVQALLAWLRANVRYTGLELDDGAWIPRRTSEVLERKYGDCKDLSVLLAAMLRAVGVEADVALLSADAERDVTPGSPGLGWFNHVIVRVGSGPALWVDPTAAWTALGELPPLVVGRNALVARQDTTALTRTTASAVSTLDTRLDIFFAPSGRARVLRKRSADGWVFSENRASAASSREQYRKSLENWAREAHKAEAEIRVETSEPTAAGPFREVLEVPGSSWGVTDAEEASGFVVHDLALLDLGSVFELDRRLDEREAPFLFRTGWKARVLNVYHPPAGYRLSELPVNQQEALGPLTVSLAWKRGAGDDVEALLEVEVKPGTFSADEARRYLDELFPKLDARIAFPNVVQAAINESRFHAAAKEAEALLAKYPSPVWRSMLAYALASAGLSSDAELEGRKALAEAPKDVTVRNHFAFALLHNARGIQFGRGYKRAEALSVIDGTLAIDPEDEWAQRLRLNVLLFDETGAFVSDPRQLARLDVELSAYRKKTESPAMDDALIDVLLKQRDWQGLLARLPKFPQTDQRDGAWMAADAVIKGEGAFQRAQREGRMNDASSGLAFQYLLFAREYEALGKAMAYLRDVEVRSGRANAAATTLAQALTTLKRSTPPPAGSVQETWMRFTALTFKGATPAELREVIGGEVSDAELAVAPRVTRNLLGDTPRGAGDLAGFSLDLYSTLGVFEQRTLPGFGELVTIRYKLPGFGPPMTQLMTKGPRGYQLRFDLTPAIAARCIERLQQGKREEARELFRAVVLLSPRAPAPLREERADLELAGFVWTATQAVGAPNASHVPRWLEEQFKRTDIDEFTHGLVLEALQKWWKDEPDKRLALARQLEASSLPGMQTKGFFVRLAMFTDGGKTKEALELVDQKLASAPRDRRLLEVKSDLLPKVGAWAKARELNRQLAADDPKREATFLNDAAWWALYDKVDEAAVQDISRVRQLSGNPSYVNTAACVYAAAGRYDQAAVELRAMVLNEQDREDDQLGAASWFARGLVAEGFGRLDTARALYKRVSKEKQSSAADVWNLAQQRLAKLGGK